MARIVKDPRVRLCDVASVLGRELASAASLSLSFHSQALVKRLKAVPGADAVVGRDASVLRAATEAFWATRAPSSQATRPGGGGELEELWLHVVADWERLAVGPVGSAVAAALRRPLVPRAPLDRYGPCFARTVSVAFYLSKRAREQRADTFCLPQAVLAAALGYHQTTVSAAIRIACRHGVLELVDQYRHPVKHGPFKRDDKGRLQRDEHGKRIRLRPQAASYRFLATKAFARVASESMNGHRATTDPGRAPASTRAALKGRRRRAPHQTEGRS